MRYYGVAIEDTAISFSSMIDVDNTGATILPVIIGSNNPNALRIAFNIELGAVGDSGSGSYIRLYGIPFSVMQQANTLAGKTVTLYAGFSPGLPLATAQSKGARRGMLMQGIIKACFGNWRGSDIALDLLVVPTVYKGQATDAGAPGPAADGGGSSASRLTTRRLPRFAGLAAVPRDASISDAITSAIGGDFSSFMSVLAGAFGGGGFREIPANLVHNLLPNMPLSTAIQQTLTTAFPGVNVKMNISSALKLAYQDGGVYQNLTQYASYIKSLSASLLNGVNSGLAKQGVDIIPHGNDAIVTDWVQPTATVMLDYTDLIGQPTWTNAVTVQFSSVLRADLYPTVAVSFPQTLFGVTLTTAAIDNPSDPAFPFSGQLTSNQNPLIFNGTIQLQSVRHVGDSRSPDGSQWRSDCTGVVTGDLASATAELANAASGFYGAPGGPGDTGGSNRFRRRAVRYYR